MLHARTRQGLLTALIMTAWVLIASSAFAATYYVDSLSGRDSNNGLSQASPWQTIAKVNSTALRPGDTVLFKRGSVWRESLMPSGSGSESAAITFAAYGAGGGRPRILGSVSKSGVDNWKSAGGNLWYCEDVSWKADGFGKLQGGMWHDGMGGQLVASKAELNQDWRWWIDAAANRAWVYLDHNPGQHAIEIQQRTGIGWTSHNHITVKDFEIAYCDNGIGIWQGQNWTIENVFVHDIVVDGVHANGSSTKPSNGKVRDSTFRDWNWKGYNRMVHDYSNWAANEPYMGYGVHVFKGDNWEVAGNTFTIQNMRSGMDSSAIAFDNGGHARLVAGNRIDMQGRIGQGPTVGLMLWATESAASEPILIANNVFTNLPGTGILLQEFDRFNFKGDVIVKGNLLVDTCLADALDAEVLRIWTRKHDGGQVIVEGNIIVGAKQGSNPHHGIRVRQSGNVMLRKNFITDTDAGISVESGSSVQAHGNISTRNRRFAIVNQATLNESYNNWHGQVQGFTPASTSPRVDPLAVLDKATGTLVLPNNSPSAKLGTLVPGAVYRWK